MIKQNISFDISVYDSIEELWLGDKELMQLAILAREKAYAPYSSFNVGAAVLLENGKIVTGSNQENAAYPSGLCAERVAVFYAGANYPGIKIEKIAITAASINYVVEKPAAPCGNCRQAISEYEVKQKAPIALLLMGEKGKVLKCDAIADILPLAFTSNYL
ncbi:cytidine deaminase [uncultured Maribacter sp.]|uniref:cytidine deaminase n=1 Tax=uncultured Maribacter sp. TaxID=431308 RepID=UPI00260E236C|nr:cytidine deaminase [uncultured Maribacter sp.]